MQEQHTRHTRADAGLFQVTERDIAALTWIGEQYAITIHQLQHLLGLQAKAETKEAHLLSSSATRHALDRWHTLGFIEQRKMRAGYSSLVWVSRRGLSALGIPYAYYRPKPSTIPHVQATNSVRLHIQTVSARAQWTSERNLRIERVRNAGSSMGSVLPDAELCLSATPIAVKVIEAVPPAPLYVVQQLRVLTYQYCRVRCFIGTAALSFVTQLCTALSDEQRSQMFFYGLEDMGELSLSGRSPVVRTPFSTRSSGVHHPFSAGF